jgi:protein HIRA/HIR1
MRLIKPSVLGHLDERGKRHAIYSVDFQPNGTRLASGASDATVKIWDTTKLLSKDGEYGELSDVLLSTLAKHTKSVNVVRWNNEGTLLASGSDDCYILIYKHQVGIAPMSSLGAAAGKESWSRCITLQGHSMDVLDLSWSPHGILASASIDNTVCIWDIRAAQSSSSAIAAPTQVLRIHESYVKGVAFDPVGKYLVSCGADNLIHVWDTETWEVSKSLDEPMRGSADRSCSLYRRVSWAPDGQSFGATACTKSRRPVGMIIKRGTWEAATDLVGHEQPSLSIRFAPNIMVSEDTEGSGAGAGIPVCSVAMGDALGVISLWSSNSNKATLVLKDVFDGKNRAATDISWMRKGGIDAFAVCSMDGSIVIVDVQGQLGRPMNSAELDNHYRKYYGRSREQALAQEVPLLVDAVPLGFLSTADKKAAALAGLEVTSPGAKSRDRSANGNGNGNISQQTMSQSSPGPLGAALNPQQILQRQTYYIDKNGKKRIRPVSMETGSPVATNTTATAVSSSSSSSSSGNITSASASVPITSLQPSKKARIEGGSGIRGGA